MPPLFENEQHFYFLSQQLQTDRFIYEKHHFSSK
jgi:hypothetical protein